MKPALVLIDLQEDYLARDPIAARREGLCQRTARLLRAFRESSLPVVHVATLYQADRSNWTLSMKRDDWPVVIEGTPGAGIDPLVAPSNGEPVVIKSRYSGFFDTNLEETLARTGADTLVCVGINTHACVRMTVLDAFERDWPIIVITDCVDSWDDEHHRVTLAYLSRGVAELVESEEFIRRLPGAQ